MMTTRHPDTPHPTQQAPEPGRPDQSCYMPELDKFASDPAMRDGQRRATPNIEAISGPVHTADRIASGRWRPARLGRLVQTMIGGKGSLRNSPGTK